ncbi:MAG: cache domain-containing protein, partial [Polyangiaceae bacterium]|nr:cache domain-containing protein [Polyangiaceae bacterium]
MKRASFYWLLPILLAILALIMGAVVERRIASIQKNELREELETLRDSNVEALKEWLHSQQLTALRAGYDEGVEQAARQLIELSEAPDQNFEELFDSDAQKALNRALGNTLQHWEVEGYYLIAGDRVIAGTTQAFLGTRLSQASLRAFKRVLAGETVVVPPAYVTLGRIPEKNPLMWVAAPVHDGNNQPIAALAFQLDPQKSFTRILRTARLGDSGETYAFDRSGLLLSQSRFDDQLKKVGLLTS